MRSFRNSPGCVVNIFNISFTQGSASVRRSRSFCTFKLEPRLFFVPRPIGTYLRISNHRLTFDALFSAVALTWFHVHRLSPPSLLQSAFVCKSGRMYQNIRRLSHHIIFDTFFNLPKLSHQLDRVVLFVRFCLPKNRFSIKFIHQTHTTFVTHFWLNFTAAVHPYLHFFCFFFAVLSFFSYFA